MTYHTPAPMVHVPTCDDCGHATLLRTVRYTAHYTEQLCATCYPSCRQAEEYGFREWPVVTASLPPLQPPADYVLADAPGATASPDPDWAAIIDDVSRMIGWCAVAAVGFAALVFVVGVLG